MNRNRRIAFLLGLVLLIPGCTGGSSNKPPRIDTFVPSQDIIPVGLGGEVELSFLASDPDGDTLSSAWSMTGDGTLTAANNSTAVTWQAPQHTGLAKVKVEVTDGRGGVVSQTWTIKIGTPLAGSDVVYVNADIDEPTHWTPDQIYVIDNPYEIYVQSALHIAPGTIIKFGQANGISTQGSGTIQAVGTPAFPIVFTSLLDHQRGGGIHQDPNAAPDSGDWGGVFLGSPSGSQFDFCEFYYGGGGPSQALLSWGEAAHVTVTNCTFAFSKGVGLDLSGVSSVNLAGNAFYGNEVPLVISANVSIGDDNLFHNPLRPMDKNIRQGIFVRSPGSGDDNEFTTEVIWGATEVAFVLTSSSTITQTGSLRLLPGTTVKFDRTALEVYGRLEAQGQPGRPVVFTSVHDDQYGGQSSGIGAMPLAGDWGSIYIAPGGKAILDHCRVRYGGTKAHRMEERAALSDDQDSAGIAVSSTVFAHNLRGLDVFSSQSSMIDSTFEYNEYPLQIGLGIDTDDGLSIERNTYDAIYVQGGLRDNTTPSLNWLNTQVPYVLNETAQFFGTIVKLGSGTVVRVWQDQEIGLYEGACFDNFEEATFTSYRDVARGGQVGGGAGPQMGDWKGIWDAAAGSYRTGTNIRYANHP